MIKFKRYFEPIIDVELIARRFAIDELELRRRKYGGRNWRKLKGTARVELFNGEIRLAELHWYECHGIGKRKIKIKQMLERV